MQPCSQGFFWRIFSRYGRLQDDLILSRNIIASRLQDPRKHFCSDKRFLSAYLSLCEKCLRLKRIGLNLECCLRCCISSVRKHQEARLTSLSVSTSLVKRQCNSISGISATLLKQRLTRTRMSLCFLDGNLGEFRSFIRQTVTWQN